MIHASQKVNGAVLWANLHLLFWLTLVTFSTGWMGENHFARLPVLVYGINLLMCAFAYTLLQNLIIKVEGEGSLLKKAVASDWKGKASPIIYLSAILIAWWFPWVSLGLYMLVALIWLFPDPRIEKFYS